MRNANQITVSNLLTHTSGIDIPNTEQPRNKSYSEAAAINWIVKHVTKNTEKKVGKWNYNNANFVLLAGIIRKTTGSSYSATVKQFCTNSFAGKRFNLFWWDVYQKRRSAEAGLRQCAQHLFWQLGPIDQR